jgi:hypothetical protein
LWRKGSGLKFIFQKKYICLFFIGIILFFVIFWGGAPAIRSNLFASKQAKRISTPIGAAIQASFQVHFIKFYLAFNILFI